MGGLGAGGWTSGSGWSGRLRTNGFASRRGGEGRECHECHTETQGGISGQAGGAPALSSAEGYGAEHYKDDTIEVYQGPWRQALPAGGGGVSPSRSVGQTNSYIATVIGSVFEGVPQLYRGLSSCFVPSTVLHVSRDGGRSAMAQKTVGKNVLRVCRH